MKNRTGQGLRAPTLPGFQDPFSRGLCRSQPPGGETILDRHPQPFVLKNPFCSPTSPIHTILCETLADTRSWLNQVDYAEGVFLQEYLGRCEAGHIALVSGGEIIRSSPTRNISAPSRATWELWPARRWAGWSKRTLAQVRVGARVCCIRCCPGSARSKYHGPIQVTAVRRRTNGTLIEYNIRIGVTSGAMLLRIWRTPWTL